MRLSPRAAHAFWENLSKRERTRALAARAERDRAQVELVDERKKTDLEKFLGTSRLLDDAKVEIARLSTLLKRSSAGPSISPGPRRPRPSITRREKISCGPICRSA